jgi:glycosyltransferase involved in cell wall biosynthesis
MTLRIQVDARLLGAGGIGRYLRELTSRWLARADVEALRFFGLPSELEPFLAEHDARGVAEIVPWADRPYSPAAQLRWPALSRAPPWTPDVTFLPHYDVPLLRHPEPSVVTVHDLIHFQVPEGFPAWKRALGLALLRGALERARAVVTVSETSRHAICRLIPAVAGKVHVVPNGVGAAFRPPTPGEAAHARGAWGLEGPFMLCVGPDKPHKNLAHAVRVLGQLPAAEGWRLVLVGPTDADCERLVARVGAAELRARVVPLAHVTDEQLRSLYATAEAVLVPSLLEGFGLPVVEARACGGTVFAGDVPWARELRASGVTLVRGWSPAVWAGEVRRSKGDSGSLSPGVWRWETAAERTLQVLQSAGDVGENHGGAYH